MSRIAFALLFLTLPAVCADWPHPGSKAGESRAAFEERMSWWRDAHFGMFIHWGPVSLTGREIGWSRQGERRGRPGTGETPLEIHDNLYKHFNPSLYDADEWVRLAKQAGMKYIVFTTKHHDGFNNWDTQVSDYKITAPEALYGRDIVKQLADACHRQGMKLGFYYSLPDWYHPDFLAGTKYAPDLPSRHEQFLEFMFAQVRELATNYGKLDILWFDLGGMVDAKTGARTCDPTIWRADELFRMLHELQPGILINNRTCLDGDFGTPEQRIGNFQTEPAWETCMTITRQWAWKPQDELKTAKQSLDVLIRATGGDGNLLYNVGPMPDGRIEPRQVDVLTEMGAWMDKYGDTIYGARGGPYTPTDWGASTRKGNRIFLHLLQWFGDGDAVLSVPNPNNRIKLSSARLLTGGKLTVQATSGLYTFRVPASARQPIDTIVELTIEGDAMALEPMAPRAQSLSYGKPTSASSETNFGTAVSAVNGDWVGHGWQPTGDDKQPWLTVDLGAPTNSARILLLEDGHHIRKFKLETKTTGDWKLLHTGARIGDRLELPLATPAQYLRLTILESEGPPALRELVVLN
jgi:alpha-L-fucosidase